MGGVGTVPLRPLGSGSLPSAMLVLFAMLSMGLLGFIDDFAKVR